MTKRKRTLRDKQRSSKHTYKTKDRVTQIPLKTGGELRCSGRVSSSCCTSYTRRVNLVTNPVTRPGYARGHIQMNLLSGYLLKRPTRELVTLEKSPKGDVKISPAAYSLADHEFIWKWALICQMFRGVKKQLILIRLLCSITNSVWQTICFRYTCITSRQGDRSLSSLLSPKLSAIPWLSGLMDEDNSWHL